MENIKKFIMLNNCNAVRSTSIADVITYVLFKCCIGESASYSFFFNNNNLKKKGLQITV